jgi:hypothetical protein
MGTTYISSLGGSSNMTPSETEYLIDCKVFKGRVTVDDLTGTIVSTSYVFGKFKGSSIDNLKKWLYKSVDKEYKMIEQRKLEL